MGNIKIFSRISQSLLEQQHHIAIYPNTGNIIEIIEKIRTAIFPSYYNVLLEPKNLASLLEDIHNRLLVEIKTALSKQQDEEEAARTAGEVTIKLLEQLPNIQLLLYKDAEAGYNGDPAARSIDEIILTYPGFFAILVYRIAHVLFLEAIPLIPRIMCEYAHSVTGIDIHPGATIGEYFFIDHGTGVVIGETTIIGNNVKLYQGVTLGALSIKSGQKLAEKRRHPTIEDNVTIYSGASILGGETVIGKNSTIGGNVFIVKSVLQNSIIKGIKQEQ